MKARKLTSKAKPEQPEYKTRILAPLAGDHFEGAAASLKWIQEHRRALSFALMSGFDAEDEATRSACYVLMQDLEELTLAAAEAAATGKRVNVHVRMRPGQAACAEYLDAVRDLAIMMRLPLESPCEGGWSGLGFCDLADLLREHMDALALGRPLRDAEVA